MQYSSTVLKTSPTFIRIRVQHTYSTFCTWYNLNFRRCFRAPSSSSSLKRWGACRHVLDCHRLEETITACPKDHKSRYLQAQQAVAESWVKHNSLQRFKVATQAFQRIWKCPQVSSPLHWAATKGMLAQRILTMAWGRLHVKKRRSHLSLLLSSLRKISSIAKLDCSTSKGTFHKAFR